MLKSFEISSQSYLETSIVDTSFLKAQLNNAENFVRENPPSQEKGSCPICGSRNLNDFFEKWGVVYKRCGDCLSIFASCGNAEADSFLFSDSRDEIRHSDAFQNSVAEHRMGIWQDKLDWVKYRCFRFLGRASNLNVLDVGNSYDAYVRLIEESDLCGQYTTVPSPRSGGKIDAEGPFDLVLFFEQLSKYFDITARLKDLASLLSEDGLLLLSTRVGTGFDILCLKENNEYIFPYEQIMLPSKRGLIRCLKDAGLEVLEFSTPGAMDVRYVFEKKDTLGEGQEFVKFMMDYSDQAALNEFQRFLQKEALSSYVQILAKRAS